MAERLASGTILSPETHQALNSWPGHKLNLLLAVDVGGTHVRLSLASPTRTDEFTVDKLLCTSHARLIAIFRSLAEELCPPTTRNASRKQVNVVAACVAAAGPIRGGGTRVVVTNYQDAGTFNGGQGISIDDLPPEVIPPEKTSFVNDLEGLCEGVIALAERGRIFDVFRQMWDGDDAGSRAPVEDCTLSSTTARRSDMGLLPVNYLVLAMGTGLGCSTLVARTVDGSRKLEHRAMALEFGHTNIVPLGPDHELYDQDQRFIRFLSETIWQNTYSAEWEDVCSGRGLVACYAFCTLGVEGAPALGDAREIAAAALAGDNPQAMEAMRLHYAYLLRFAQQLCVGLQAKGVFLAGDNQVGNMGFFWGGDEEDGRPRAEEIAHLRQAFEHHQKKMWLQPAEVWAQSSSMNLNVMGCFHVAERLRTT